MDRKREKKERTNKEREEGRALKKNPTVMMCGIVYENQLLMLPTTSRQR